MNPGFLIRRRARRRLGAAIRQADRARDAGRFSEAADNYGVALALDPGRVDLRVQRANMLKDKGDFALAEQEYLTALAAEPGSADINLQLGHLRSVLGRRVEALAAYGRALDLDPDSESARRALVLAGDPGAQTTPAEALRRAQGLSALATLSFRLETMVGELAHIRAALPEIATLTAFPLDAYGDYRALFDLPALPTSEPRQAAITIDVIVQADAETLEDLHRLMTALIDQSHTGWRFHAIGRNSDRQDIVRRAAARDPRFAWVEATASGDPILTEHTAAAAAEGDFALFLAKGALPHRHALAWIATARVQTGCAAMVFDEETGERGAIGGPLQPLLRQTLDPDTLVGANVYGDTLAVAVSVLRTAPPPPPGESRAFARSRLLLDLSASGPIAHVPLPLFSTPCDGPPITAARADAHRRALESLGGKAEASPWSRLIAVKTADLARPDARISVIIPTRDNLGDLWPLLESLVTKAGRPAALEILILNNGAPGGVQPRRECLGPDAVFKVIEVPESFNWSRFNNLAAAVATSPYLVFANDDMRMLSAGWDDGVRRYLERDDVGALGAKLLYPDQTIQHAGVLFGWRGSTIHDGLHRAADDPGPALRWITPRAVGAVTGAFLATRKADFSAAGGFDEARLAIAYSDVDYALKLRARGLKVLWTPEITLHHYESKSRGLDHLDPARRARDTAEREVMRERWGKALDEDPSLNPHWRDIALPHQFLAAPSRDSVVSSLVRSAVRNPWRV